MKKNLEALCICEWNFQSVCVCKWNFHQNWSSNDLCI